MKYSDIVAYPRHHDTNRFPVVAHVEIESCRLRQFENLIEDQTQTRMLGHDPVGKGRVVVHVGCTSDDVRDAIEHAWA